MTDTIAPHGGALVQRLVPAEERDRWMSRLPSLPRIVLTRREISDLEMIAVGAFSPLDGFLGEADYDSVVSRMRLAGGLPWTIPVTLAVSREEAESCALGRDVALVEESGKPLAVLRLAEKYRPDKRREAAEVYRTTEEAHPGVAAVYAQGEVYLGGRVTVLDRPSEVEFADHRLDPAQARALFAAKGWKRIAAFQTRNPIHRAHEYLQKCALESCDGLLIHPLVGETKGDDIPASVRMECYKALIKDYYPADRVVLSVLPANMRYAGPREAIFHAILRKNYGCTHFIVGRDHAGVGSYYGTYDAHRIFDHFSAEEIGITPLFYEHTFWCQRCEGMASTKTCPHPPEHHIALSGTGVRAMLSRGERPPMEFSRPEVADILIRAMRQP
ncbi:MAG: sulfate adenylyltransferase [Deltaproteobacteria bacterium]|nr:sulfate adenylyltransferase [Deltaproteobacteria bacterium]